MHTAPDVLRDMAFYRTVVELRNALERMQIRRGRPIDTDHLWWGFGDLGDLRHPPDDPGLAGSRVPKRPPDGAGGAVVELDEPNLLLSTEQC